MNDSSRRDFFRHLGGGLGGIALADLLLRDGVLALAAASDNPPNSAQAQAGEKSSAGAGGLHHRARAKRVVQLFMSGAASQVDTFDYKPELVKRHGQPWNPGEKVELFQSMPGAVMQSPWKWKQYGQCGKWMSDLVVNLGGCVDRMAFIPSMTSRSNVHGPATFLQATGFVLPGFPSAGAWISYGLGGMNDSLPTFVVLPDSRGYAPNGPKNWSNGFLPAAHQGTMIKPGGKTPIADLYPPENSWATKSADADALALLNELNKSHLAGRELDTRLEARIASYELAAKLQLTAPQALDLSRETKAVRDLYGLDDPVTADFGRNCLVARRLLERGVRFVQVWSGADNGFPRRNWDSHEDIARDHGVMGKSMDRPAAALLLDLEKRGLLDETIVHWTTEFGRMPCAQGSLGRDHNPFTFTNWLAGGGVKCGVVHGASDEWSYKAVDKPTACYDVYATILHLMGIDHTRLVFRHNGIDRRLTDVHGHVIKDLLA